MDLQVQKNLLTSDLLRIFTASARSIIFAALFVLLIPTAVSAALTGVGQTGGGGGGAVYNAPEIEPPNFGQHRETVQDMKVKVMGGYFRVNRTWDSGAWYINHDLDKFELGFVVKVGTEKAIISYEGESYGEVFIYTDKATGVRSIGLPQTASEIGYSKERFKRLVWTGSAFRIIDKWGNWTEFYTPGDVLVSHVYATKQGNRNNVQVRFEYAPSSTGDGGYKKITGVFDHLGKQIIWYEYNNPADQRKVSAIRDYTNRRVEYKYVSGNLTEVTDVRGNIWAYTYEASGQTVLLKTKTDPDGRKKTITYNPNQTVHSILNQDLSGSYYRYEFLEGKKEFYKQEKTAGGKVIETWYDKEGDFIRRDINGVTVIMITKQGQNKTLTDRSGNITKYELDQWDNLTKKIHPDNFFITRTYDPKYSSLLEEVNERGVITKYQYDTNGNLTTKTEAFGLPEQRVITYTYDQYGNQLSRTHEADAVTAQAVYAWTYDEYGNKITNTDGEKNIWAYSYDVIGNLLTTTEPVSTKIWTYTYDAAGNQTSMKDPLGNLTQYVYDGWGNRTKLIDAKLQSTAYTYNANNRLAKITDHLNNDVVLEYNTDGQLIKLTDQTGKIALVNYDLEGRPITFIDGSNNTTQYIYNGPKINGAGNVSAIKFPTFDRSYTYDVRGRVVGQIDKLSVTQSYESVIAYDAVGNIVKTVDPKKRTTLYTPDAFNRMVKLIDPLNQETLTGYDNRDNIRSVTDPKGNTTAYNVDGNNLVVSETQPMGQTLSYSYNSSGRLVSYIDIKGQKIAYLYDDAGRITTINNYPSITSATPVKTVNVNYDAVSLLSSYDDGTTSASYTYDALNRNTTTTVNYGPFSKSIGYSYTANGQKQSYTAPDGAIHSFSYNASGQLSTIQIPGVGAITVNTFEWQQPKTVSFPGGVSTEFTYDGLQRMQSNTVKDPAKNLIMSSNYSLDSVGNILNQQTEHGLYQYNYDDLDRLTSADNPNLLDEVYTYDPVGNRLTDNNKPGTWGYNKNNQLTGIGTSTTFTYDANGSVTSKSDAGVATDYVYNSDNRLSEVKQGATTIATYNYDPFGRRISKNVAGTLTYFMYADEGLIAEFDATGSVIRQFGYQPDSTWGTDPTYLKTGGQYYFYQNDHLGTPKKMTAANGAIVWSAEYQAFGGLQLASNSTIENPLRFAGQYFDAETGLHYNYFRYYDPSTGRYITSDPIGLAGGLNAYGYVGGNPLSFTDSYGLAPGTVPVPGVPGLPFIPPVVIPGTPEHQAWVNMVNDALNNSSRDDDWPFDEPDPTKDRPDTTETIGSCPTEPVDEWDSNKTPPGTGKNMCAALAAGIFKSCRVKGGMWSACASKAATIYVLCMGVSGGGSFGGASRAP